MEFNLLVVDRIKPILAKNGFELIEQRENFFRFRSIFAEAIVSYNSYDMRCLFQIGEVNKDLVELSNNALKLFFKSKIKIYKKTKEAFIANLALFLTTDGSEILQENSSKLREFLLFIEKSAHEYTKRFIKK